jgi:hypothetical protein
VIDYIDRQIRIYRRVRQSQATRIRYDSSCSSGAFLESHNRNIRKHDRGKLIVEGKILRVLAAPTAHVNKYPSPTAR